jgi:hypothetical protein
VIYGRSAPLPALVELSGLDGSNGFVIYGIDAEDRLTAAANDSNRALSLGDVNGDGRDDLAIGGQQASNMSGEAYVVFSGIQLRHSAAATAETTVYGTRAGNLADTQVSDNVYETLTEGLYGSYSQLEHRWTFSVGGKSLAFAAEAHRGTTNETFAFEYSTNGSTWTRMFVVAKTADDNLAQAYNLPSSISGTQTAPVTVWVRVVDTDRRRNERTLDTILVDEMFISFEPVPGAAQSLAAGAAGATAYSPALLLSRTVTTDATTRGDRSVGSNAQSNTVAAGSTSWGSQPPSESSQFGLQPAAVDAAMASTARRAGPSDDSLGANVGQEIGDDLLSDLIPAW